MKKLRIRAALSLVLVVGSLDRAVAQPLPLPPAPPGARAAPHALHSEAPPEDSSNPDVNLPARKLVIEVRRGDGTPVPGASVELVTAFESIAEGKRSEKKSVVSDANGNAIFDGLDPSLRFSYVVAVRAEGGTYVVPGFRMSEKVGHRARVHVYPATSDIRSAFVGMRGFVLVELRDGVFQFDVLYRVINLSRTSWVSRDLTLRLPAHAEALSADGSEENAGFSARDDRVALVGTFPPGQRDVRFQFQVPMRGNEKEVFEIGVPPHVAELRVLAEAASGMTLSVPGFETPEPTRGPDGKKLLITRRVMQPGQSELDRVVVELHGLPTLGSSRYVASALGFALFGLGLVVAFRKKRGSSEVERDRTRAREILLDEIVELERAYRNGAIGPVTYETSKKQLLDALSRLEEPENPTRGVAPVPS